jgi:acylphosphatase
VQGVGFRWFVRERARALGLSGWVRNEPDGSVKVYAIGRQSDLAQLRQMLCEGPPEAMVEMIVDEQLEPNIPALTPFGVLK